VKNLGKKNWETIQEECLGKISKILIRCYVQVNGSNAVRRQKRTG
jgi:hypothetical protein